MSLPGRRSTRTVDAPMSFTPGEFIRGALYAWLWFLLFANAVHIPLFGLWFFYVLYYTLPWSIGALVVGSVPAYLLGTALRRRTSLRLHAGLFTLFGASVGVVTTTLAFTVPWSSLYEGAGVYSLSTALVCACATIAVPLGWWQTARRALRRDHG
jgi:hypothetical protein